MLWRTHSVFKGIRLQMLYTFYNIFTTLSSSNHDVIKNKITSPTCTRVSFCITVIATIQNLLNNYFLLFSNRIIYFGRNKCRRTVWSKRSVTTEKIELNNRSKYCISCHIIAAMQTKPTLIAQEFYWCIDQCKYFIICDIHCCNILDKGQVEDATSIRRCLQLKYKFLNF